LLAFNRTISKPSGILPKLPITLEGKAICIDLMVVQGPLDFHFLLGYDYVYDMKVVVSTLFFVISFPHNGNIVMVYQLSYVDLALTTSHLTPLKIPYMKVIPTLTRVNYVANHPRFSIIDANEPLIIFLTSYDLNLVIYIGNLMGEWIFLPLLIIFTCIPSESYSLFR